MLYTRSEPSRKINVTIEMSVEIARHLLDLKLDGEEPT